MFLFNWLVPHSFTSWIINCKFVIFFYSILSKTGIFLWSGRNGNLKDTSRAKLVNFISTSKAHPVSALFFVFGVFSRVIVLSIFNSTYIKGLDISSPQIQIESIDVLLNPPPPPEIRYPLPMHPDNPPRTENSKRRNKSSSWIFSIAFFDRFRPAFHV